MTPPETRLLIETANAVAVLVDLAKLDHPFMIELVNVQTRLNAAILYYDDFERARDATVPNVPK